MSRAVCFLGINKMDKLTPRGRLACQRFAGRALGIKHQGEEERKQEWAGWEAGLWWSLQIDPWKADWLFSIVMSWGRVSWPFISPSWLVSRCRVPWGIENGSLQSRNSQRALAGVISWLSTPTGFLLTVFPVAVRISSSFQKGNLSGCISDFTTDTKMRRKKTSTCQNLLCANHFHRYYPI